jgi:hypothetical protein
MCGYCISPISRSFVASPYLFDRLLPVVANSVFECDLNILYI